MTNQEAFHELLSSLKKDPEELRRFYQDPAPFLKKAGIPVFKKPSDIPGGTGKPPSDKRAAARAKAPASGFSVGTHWWGITFVMNEQITNKVVTGQLAATTLGSIIAGGLVGAGVITGPMGAVVGASFGAAFALKAAEIKLIDNGNGVYWPVTWPQWAAVALGAVTGPSTLVAAISAFVHPLPN